MSLGPAMENVNQAFARPRCESFAVLPWVPEVISLSALWNGSAPFPLYPFFHIQNCVISVWNSRCCDCSPLLFYSSLKTVLLVVLGSEAPLSSTLEEELYKSLQ